jgi:predicted mannosyl-3-phosphoglycerate phosphatase (HAD superfamily)
MHGTLCRLQWQIIKPGSETEEVGISVLEAGQSFRGCRTDLNQLEESCVAVGYQKSDCKE